jgi:uncharacterized cofD-like protein
MPKNNINITTIGWGSWSYSLLSSLRDNEDYNLSAIISMSDNGGSTWILREEFNMLPPGDVRRGVMALSHEHELVRQLFDYRYEKECSVWGHNLWNLLITAMAEITGSFDKWLKQICRMFKVRGKVIPVTLELSQLHARLEDGQIIKWETNIDEPKHDANLKIEEAFLEPEVNANEKALKAIEKSNLIIISHWDLYTSIIPNFLVKWISNAVKKSNAKVVYFCNLMTKKWETNDFWVLDFIDTLEKYLWKDIIDYVVVNNWYISDKLAEKYKSAEWKSPVKLKEWDKKIFKNKKYKIIETDLLHENYYVRHSYDKIAGVVEKIVKKL